jgi:hypothetical protein
MQLFSSQVLGSNLVGTNWSNVLSVSSLEYFPSTDLLLGANIQISTFFNHLTGILDILKFGFPV